MAELSSSALTALMGVLFGILTQYKMGRSFLLNHAKLFTLGTFSDEGPTEVCVTQRPHTRRLYTLPSRTPSETHTACRLLASIDT